MKSKEDRNPYEKAGFFSTASLAWLYSILRLGNKRPLKEDDLFPLIENHKTEVIVERFEQKWKDEILRAEIQGRRPRLWRAMFGFVSLFEYVLIISLKISESLASFSTVVFLWYYLKLLWENDNISIWYSIGAVAGIGTSCIARAFLLHHNRLQTLLVGMKFKVAMIGIVYKKLLSSSRCSVSKVGAGKVINIVSNGAMRMEEIGMNLMFCTITPLDNFLALTLAWILFGWASLSGIGAILLLLGLQVWSSKVFANYRRKQTVATDKRLSTMNDIIKGIRMVKMCGWEDNYSTRVRQLRRKEVTLVRVKNLIIAFSQGLLSTLAVVGTLVSAITLLYTGNHLNSVTLFTLVRVLSFITESITLQVYGSRNLHDGIVTVNRVEKYLLPDVEFKAKKLVGKGSKSVMNTVGKYFALFDNKHENSWRENKRINLNYTLLNNSQTKHQKASLEVQNTVVKPRVQISQMSCCWIDKTNRSTLNNISLNLESSELLIVTGTVGSGKTTLLMSILQEIIVQEGQVSTQGQIAYVGQIPWIFTGTVRENILFGEPYDKERYERVLESCDLLQDVQRFPKGDMSMLGQRGVLLSGGQRIRVGLARAVYSKSDIFLLDDPLSAVDWKVGQHLFDKCICGELSGKIRILVTHQVQHLHRADEILVLNEGAITSRGSFEKVVVKENILTGKIVLSDSNQIISGREVSNRKSQGPVTASNFQNEFRGADLEEEEENVASGRVSSKLYRKYMQAGSPVIAVVMILIFSFIVEGFIVAPNWYLKILSHMPYKNQRSTESVGTFAGLVASALVLGIIRMIFFYILLLRTSEKLHDVITQAVIKTKVLFFDTNPVGRIMNRFSKDIGTMDDILPFKFGLFFAMFFQFLGVLVVTGAVNYWFVFVILPTVAVFLYFAHFYLKSARELSRMEAVCCSPVYDHISETIEGLEVIHSLNMQHLNLQKFYYLQNNYTKAFSLVLMTSRWAGINADLICAIFATIISIGTLVLSMDSASTGLVLSCIISLMRISSSSVRHTSDAETKMISVERVTEYTKLPPEPGYASQTKPPKDWPTDGAVSLRGVYMSYQEAGPKVLKDISFDVNPTEKVGIVGRTGAGKSSLVAALFRMPDPKGEVIIDGIDLGTLNIQSARSSMAVITQDPILFAGKLRGNLDPFDSFTEDEIWTALKEVQMLERIQKLNNQLDYQLGEEGSGFSIGEKQLLCLARALLQRSKILVLDEATANVDFETDQLIQKVIREKFAHCTVLTIAHRLNTILDYDRVLVLDQGCVVRYDSPAVLARETGGIFAKMLESQGLQIAI